MAEELTDLLDWRTAREAVPALLSDEPFPEHVFDEISSVPKDVLRPADEWLGAHQAVRILQSRRAHAHALHSFVGPRPSSGSATSTPTPFLRSKKGVKDVTSCDDRTSSRAKKDAPDWKTEWRRRKQLKEGPVLRMRRHSTAPSRTDSSPERSLPASARGLSSTRSRSSSSPAPSTCTPPPSSLTPDAAAPNFINRTYTSSNRSADHVPSNFVRRKSTASPLNLSPHDPLHRPASSSPVRRIKHILSAERSPASPVHATAPHAHTHTPAPHAPHTHAPHAHALKSVDRHSPFSASAHHSPTSPVRAVAPHPHPAAPHAAHAHVLKAVDHAHHAHALKAVDRHSPFAASARLICPAQAPHRVEYTEKVTVEV
ncbi:hypothetical protein T484DRAFT_3627972 [Baffinella frigidus]|nr:hypothetical protein T484DRAFT_3627972 [Cryptophyta sp. CCMP2293]